VNRLYRRGPTCCTVIHAGTPPKGSDPITTEQTSMHHISAPHITSDVPVPGYPVCRFMYSIHNCILLRCRKNCQGTRDLLSIRRSITSHRAERQTDCLRKRRTVRRMEGTSSPHWTTFSWASTTHVPGVVHAALWNAVLVNWRGTRAPQMSARTNIRMSRTPLPAPQSVKRPR